MQEIWNPSSRADYYEASTILFATIYPSSIENSIWDTWRVLRRQTASLQRVVRTGATAAKTHALPRDAARNQCDSTSNSNAAES